MHRAIRLAGFVCVQSYPIKAEMSVSMPLQQARSPIHLDLIVVCRTESQSKSFQNGELDIADAIGAAKRQVASLKGVGIKVSLGDAKVILMGRLLCEIHGIKNLDLEEKLLEGIEGDIDSFVGQIMLTKGEVLYDQAGSRSVQLALFEEMEKYLANRRI